MPVSQTLSFDEPEDRNLRSAIESYGKQVSQPAADVQPAPVIKVELARGVAAVRNRQHRRRQKWGLALPPVRVPREDPPLKPRPVVPIGRIGKIGSN